MGDQEIAVWDGRFQPLHKGHVAVMQAIIRQFDTDLVVLIIQSSEGVRDEYGEEVNKHHKLSRNPLSFWERYQLIRLATQDLECAKRIHIFGIPRPDLHWNIVRSFYPDNRFICLTGKDEYEQHKEQFWAGLGEKTRLVDITGIPTISATDFKLALKSGTGYDAYLPTGVAKYFHQIDAPARFKRADL